MAKVIKVGKGSTRYDVVIAKNAITKVNLLNQLKTRGKVFVITDSGVPKKYIDEVKLIRISFTSSIYFLGTPESVITNTLPLVFSWFKRFTFVIAFFAITTS